MFRPSVILASLVLIPPAAAGPIDSATLAAMRLGEAPNYSWECSVNDDARSYARRGKHALAGGYTWVTLPMIESLAAKLGREAGTDIEAIFERTGKCVIRIGERWRAVTQLTVTRRNRAKTAYFVVSSAARIHTPDMPADMTEADSLSPALVIFPMPVREEDENKPLSTARLAPSAPHEELALIVSSWEQVVIDGDTIRGRLNDIGSRLLLCPGPDVEPSAVIAAGEFALTIKAGRVTRYRLTLEALMRVGKKKQVLVRQTSETVINAVGTTKFDVPDEALRQLATR